MLSEKCKQIYRGKKSMSVVGIMWRKWWVNGWVWKKLKGIILKISCSSRIWYSVSQYLLSHPHSCVQYLGMGIFWSESQKEREDIVENTEMHTVIFLQLFLALDLSALTTRHWQRVRWEMLGSASRESRHWDQRTTNQGESWF